MFLFLLIIIFFLVFRFHKKKGKLKNDKKNDKKKLPTLEKKMEKIDMKEIERNEHWAWARVEFLMDGDKPKYKMAMYKLLVAEKDKEENDDESVKKIRYEMEKKKKNLEVEHTQRIMVLECLHQKNHNDSIRDKEGIIYYIDRTFVYLGAGLVFFNSWKDVVVSDLTKGIIVMSLLTVFFVSSIYFRYVSNNKTDAKVAEEEKFREEEEIKYETKKAFLFETSNKKKNQTKTETIRSQSSATATTSNRVENDFNSQSSDNPQ